MRRRFSNWLFAVALLCAGAALPPAAQAQGSAPEAQAGEGLKGANKALEDAARELEAAQEALKNLPDVTPEEVNDACAATFSQPQHVAACQAAVAARASGGPPPKLSYAELENLRMAYSQMVDAAPVGPDQEAKLTPAQKVMWGMLYEEDAQAMQKLCAHPDAYKPPGDLDLPQRSQEQVLGHDPQMVPGTCTDPSAWAKQEAKRREEARDKAQQDVLKP